MIKKQNYCKLEHWGIQVYAAIDVYSRFIIWIYAGISARSAMSVFKQYLITIRDSHVMPRLIRTDRGGETVLAADAHYYVSSDVRRDEAPLRFGDCFRYGTSKQNQRIEAWWNQLRRARISRWRERFSGCSLPRLVPRGGSRSPWLALVASASRRWRRLSKSGASCHETAS